MIKTMNSPIKFGNVYGLKPFHQLLDNVWNEAIQTQQEQIFRPTADITETNDKFEVHLTLPGIKKEDIKIEVKENVLTISAEKQFVKEENDAKVHLKENFYGKIERGFKLPKNVDQNSISAQLVDGILQLKIAKKVEEKETALTITIND